MSQWHVQIYLHKNVIHTDRIYFEYKNIYIWKFGGQIKVYVEAIGFM